MGNLNDWVDGAENQWTTAGGHTPSASLPEPPGAAAGAGPLRLAAAVGLVRPPPDIVLWDEFTAALKRLVRKNPEVRREARNSVKQSTRKKKEVSGDQHGKMALR